jgi:hypothetical protein
MLFLRAGTDHFIITVISAYSGDRPVPGFLTHLSPNRRLKMECYVENMLITPKEMFTITNCPGKPAKGINSKFGAHKITEKERYGKDNCSCKSKGRSRENHHGN